jgi:voltage-gated potassium channel
MAVVPAQTSIRRPTFPVVLALLIAVIVFVPVVEEVAHLRLSVMLRLAGLAVPILAVSAASDRRRHRHAAFALAAVSVLANGVTFPRGGVPLWVGNAATLSFLAFTTYLVLRTVITSAEVTPDVISGALASYVMIGLTWAIAFGIVEARWSGSIRFAADSHAASFSDLLYFSYVTLLTIGYGDVTPVSSAARTLAVLEGLAGMTFTTVLLAVLVAKLLLSDRSSR